MKGMMKPLCFAAGLLVAAACARPASLADEALDYCVKKVTGVQERLGADYGESPRNIAPGDCRWNLTPVCQENWTMGFWPGILWYAYEASGDAALETAARGYTEALDFIARQPAYDHDIGFIMFPSFGNGFRLTGDPAYKEAVLATAERLAALFNPAVGTILSWPREVPNFGGHNTIMDNMLNLETLFWAAENGGDPAWKDIAITHADTTMRYNFRPDGTSYHVAVYDAETGAYQYSCTHQGYADDSMWARGQAWGIYGYTMVYRFTREPRFLEFAQKIADVYLARLPEDKVPRAEAEAMLSSLYENYRAPEGCDSFLLHSTGHHPAGKEIDYSIVYADYYFIEALLRLKNL